MFQLFKGLGYIWDIYGIKLGQSWERGLSGMREKGLGSSKNRPLTGGKGKAVSALVKAQL
jgi:hypothetical protein